MLVAGRNVNAGMWCKQCLHADMAVYAVHSPILCGIKESQ